MIFYINLVKINIIWLSTMLQLVIEVFISCYINLEELKGKSEKGSFKVWSHRQDLFSIHWFTPALKIVQFNCMLYPISSMLGRCQHNFPSHMHMESPQKNMAFFQYLEESCIIVLISKEKIGLVTNSSTTIWPCSLRWKNKPKYCSCWFVVREKH